MKRLHIWIFGLPEPGRECGLSQSVTESECTEEDGDFLSTIESPAAARKRNQPQLLHPHNHKNSQPCRFGLKSVSIFLRSFEALLLLSDDGSDISNWYHGVRPQEASRSNT